MTPVRSPLRPGRGARNDEEGFMSARAVFRPESVDCATEAAEAEASTEDDSKLRRAEAIVYRIIATCGATISVMTAYCVARLSRRSASVSRAPRYAWSSAASIARCASATSSGMVAVSQMSADDTRGCQLRAMGICCAAAHAAACCSSDSRASDSCASGNRYLRLCYLAENGSRSGVCTCASNRSLVTEGFRRSSRAVQ